MNNLASVYYAAGKLTLTLPLIQKVATYTRRMKWAEHREIAHETFARLDDANKRTRTPLQEGG
jgi:hypothetical protein